MTITRSRTTELLDRRRGLPPHEPVWSDADCRECADQTFTQCGPHPDVLCCVGCGEDWPCEPVSLVVEELFERGQELWNLADAADQDRPEEATAYHYAVVVLRERARYLEGSPSGSWPGN